MISLRASATIMVLRVPIRLSAVRARGSQEAGRRSRGVEFAPDSPLEGDGFELLVPRHKSRGFPQHSGHLGVPAGLLNDTT